LPADSNSSLGGSATSDSAPDLGKSALDVYLGVGAAVLIVLAVLIILIVWYFRRQAPQSQESDEDKPADAPGEFTVDSQFATRATATSENDSMDRSHVPSTGTVVQWADIFARAAEESKLWA
jgi:hypothetical protein